MTSRHHTNDIIYHLLISRITATDGTMAYLQTSQNASAQIADPESDYGSDLDEAIVDTLLSQAQSFAQPPPPLPSQQGQEAPLYPVLTSIEDPVLQDAPSSIQRSVRFARTTLQQDLGNLDASYPPHPLLSPARRERSIEVEYHPRNRGTFSRKLIYLAFFTCKTD